MKILHALCCSALLMMACSTEHWTVLRAMPEQRYRGGAVTVGGKIYFVGGMREACPAQCASDRVDIRSDGSLTGDVVAARISIEDGAFFKGGIDIRKAGSAGTAKVEEVKSISSSAPEPAIAARA